MAVQFLKRNFFQRLFGIPATAKPKHPDCWQYAGGKVIVDLTIAPELAEAGGALRLEGGGLPLRILVTRDGEGQYHAFHNRCSHAGHRRLDPVPGTSTVQCCSVNKSTYDLSGKNLFGPAPKPVAVYPVEIDGNRLIVSIETKETIAETEKA